MLVIITESCRFRIKDPKRSLDFYTRVMGLQLLEKLDFAETSFSLYFLGQYEASQIPENSLDRVSAPLNCRSELPTCIDGLQ